MGVASLVLGIVGLILSFIPCVGWIALALTIPGVILGAIGISAAKKSGQGKGISVAGLVCSLLATIFAVVWMLLIAGATSATASAIDEIAKEVEKAEKRQAERAEQNRWNSGSEDFERELKRESEKLQKELDSKMDELLNNL